VVNVVLMILALVLVAAAAIFFTGVGTSADDTKAQSLSRQYKAVTKSASGETLAFLTINYNDVDTMIDKVLAGATGSFKSQYSSARTQLKSSATTAKAVSTGKILSAGISELDSKSAVVFVAANSSVTNSSTKGKAQPRYYRLKLTMVRQGGKWLTSNLEFVG
jgi:Mce-associated membrane protein